MLIKMIFSLMVIMSFVITGLAYKIALRAKAGNNIASFMRKIYHKENIQNEYIDFCVKKIKKFSLIVGVFGVVGLIYVFAKEYENKQVTELSKPKYGD